MSAGGESVKKHSELQAQGDNEKEYPLQTFLLELENKPRPMENISTSPMLLYSGICMPV